MEPTEPVGGAEAAADLTPRRITDPRALRALAHPLRMALVEALVLHGTLTATEAAEIVGGTPSNISYHLRSLAKYGFVEEAEGGVGRERPWKPGAVSLRLDYDEPDPAVTRAARTLLDVTTERWQERKRRYQRDRDTYPRAVQKVSGESQFLLFCTPEEMAQLQEELMERLLAIQGPRFHDPSLRPEGAVPFEFIVSTTPYSLDQQEG
ncbi:DNA-binding transcriptional ArsR family regulator [Streptacidiphilus sp. BW17]|uniref:helix-turn-helix domain-containing protein n=1 Tax=Streptacidiphilus sp. BW17 TaxID=3156274 RepID=UPI003512BA62